MRPPQGAEWLLILMIVLLLFGGKKLPDMARGLGRSLRILKAETKGLADDDADEPAIEAQAQPPVSQVEPPSPQPAPKSQSQTQSQHPNSGT